MKGRICETSIRFPLPPQAYRIASAKWLRPSKLFFGLSVVEPEDTSTHKKTILTIFNVIVSSRSAVTAILQNSFAA